MLAAGSRRGTHGPRALGLGTSLRSCLLLQCEAVAQDRPINPALDEALRELGRPTTPEDLRRRGVKRVRAVGMREVSLLIERAVNRTLVERTLAVPHAVVEELVQSAQDEFLKQLQGLTDLADSRELVERHKREWRQSLAELRRRVAERRGFIEQRPPLPPDSSAEREFAALAAAALADESDPARRTRWVQALTALHLRGLSQAVDDVRREHDAEFALLERRLEKLVASLEGAELALERAANTRAADLGIESIYKSVQGLPSGERARELKSALMASIFEANLELRRQGGKPAGQPATGAGAPQAASSGSSDQTTE